MVDWSSSSSSYGPVTVVTELEPGEGNTKSSAWKHEKTVRTEPYISVWKNGVISIRCKQSSAILRNDVYNFNYVDDVRCLAFFIYKKWLSTLTIIKQFIVTTIELARIEFRDRYITGEEVHELVDAQFFGLGEHSLRINIKNFLERKKCARRNKEIKEVAHKMVEWEAEEDSGC